MREVVPAELAEGEERAADEARGRRTRDDTRQDRSSITAEGQSEEEGDVVDRQRRQADQVEGEGDESDAEEVLAEGERILRRVENRRLVHRPPVRPGVVVPVENPGVEQRIAEVGDRRLQPHRHRPGEDDGHGEKEGEEEQLAGDLLGHLRGL